MKTIEVAITVIVDFQLFASPDLFRSVFGDDADDLWTVFVCLEYDLLDLYTRIDGVSRDKLISYLEGEYQNEARHIKTTPPY